jgi:ribonuclease BN (tRNA processing enzyme)
MADLRLVPLGVGDAFAATRYTQGLALEFQGQWLLVDCPHPIRKMMREAGSAAGLPLDVDRVLGVALTHLHADHASGLEDFGYYSYFALARKATLVAHPRVLDHLWDGLLSAGMGEMLSEPGARPARRNLWDYFQVQAIEESRPVTLGPFQIECRPTIHSIFTTAFRIQAGGRKIGISADTAFDPSLIAWLDEAHLVVHEATTHVQAGLHTHYDQLLTLPSKLKKKIRLVHFPDEFNVETSAIPALRQGECLIV